MKINLKKLYFIYFLLNLELSYIFLYANEYCLFTKNCLCNCDRYKNLTDRGICINCDHFRIPERINFQVCKKDNLNFSSKLDDIFARRSKSKCI